MSWTMVRSALVKVLLALALMLGATGPGLMGTAYAQVATTTVADTVYQADGTPAGGTVIVSWQAFTTMSGKAVPGGNLSVAIGAGGALSVALAPNAGANPVGSYYTVVYHLNDGTVQREYWVVPASAGPVALAAIKSTVVPTSVAMQTVSKTYVDAAIAAALTGSPQDTSPYVLKAGDTMTGALNLPADPVSANQAADKHYVDVMVGSGAGGSSTGAVKLLPSGTQVVTQPAATDLEVNRLNGAEASNLYATPGVDNGIAKATAAADCTGASAAGVGCTVLVPSTVGGTEKVNPLTWGNQTHVIDQRFGSQHDTYLNPHNPDSPEYQTGQQIDVRSTESTQQVFQNTGGQIVGNTGLTINMQGLAGGSNLFPENLEHTPYFKTTYSGLVVNGSYNTLGQHVLNPMTTECFGVGDCLIGSQFLKTMGGFRDSADEGTHPYDIQVSEDPRVFQGVCSSGCSTGSQLVTIGSQTSGGTQGEGRFLIDKNPAKVISQGLLTGGTSAGIHPSASFSGTSFPVSTFFATNAAVLSQASDLAPGTVSVAIATSGVPAGYATNTAAAPSGSGVACVADRGSLPNFETASYTVADGTHLQMTLAKPHGALATVSIGGLCGYGAEQTVDTANGMRQVFPVIGSPTSTSLYYAGSNTSVLGVTTQTSAFVNLNLTVLSAVRSNNSVTLQLANTLPMDVNGLTMTMAGVTDSSFNGSFRMTSASGTTLTYPETGANSTTSGGTVSYLTGGYALYPMAETKSVFNATTKAVDGQITLTPNTVAWAANDPVEQPHYFQMNVAPDTTFVNQTSPRPTVFQSAGITYSGNNGPGLRGFQVTNLVPASNYFGNGGTHLYPDISISSLGIWNRTFEVQAGEQSLLHALCNSKGCNRWNSGYNLFELDSAVGSDLVGYQPNVSSLQFTLRGTGYSFTPQAFNAGTANIGTLNVTTLNAANMQGGAPAAGTAVAGGGLAIPGALNTGLLADYNFYQQSGTTLKDMSGNGNDGTLASGALAPTWTSQGLSFSPGQGVSLPAALNPAQTFVIETYLNPLAALGGPNNNYPALVTSSLGQNGVNLLTDYAIGTQTYATRYAYAPSIYGGSAQRSAVPNLLSGFHVLAYVLGTGGSSLDHIYIDGVEAASYTAQVASGGLQTTGNLFFGSSNTGPWVGSGLFGTAYRMRAYSTALAPADVATVTQAMYSEAAVRGIPTAPVAVNQAGPQFHAIGDSITYGFLANAPWPSLLSLTNQPAYTVTNWGITGITALSVAASEPNRVAPLCRSSAGPAVAVAMLGTNDLASLPGSTVQTVFRTAMGEVQTLKQAGCRVFFGTMLSRVGNDPQGGSMDADKDAYDALILSSARALGADGVIDFAANPLLGADGANANSYFNSDRVHPTSAGQQLMANAASNALNYYFGANEASPKVVNSLPYTMAAGDGYVSVSNLTGAGLLTLPDCTGQSGATYRVNNLQGTYAVMVGPQSGSQPINGLSVPVTVPANGSVTLRDVPNPKTVSGCHWEM